jgi:methionyl-tRNA synthetase
VKDSAKKERLQQVLFYSMESCRIAGILLQCVMPEKADSILNRLGVQGNERKLCNAAFGSGWPTKYQQRDIGVSFSPVIFPRIK